MGLITLVNHHCFRAEAQRLYSLGFSPWWEQGVIRVADSNGYFFGTDEVVVRWFKTVAGL